MLLLGIIAIIIYANTIGNKFAVDDSVMLVNNKIVAKGFAGIPELFATPHQWGFWVNKNDEYRPFSLAVFAAIHEVFELNPIPYHLVNILLFACCVMLLFRFVHQLLGKEQLSVAFIAALLFAVHPIHTEVVANVKSSDELWCFFFAFLGLRYFTKYTRTGKNSQLAAGGVLFFLSVMSKETTLTMMAILPVTYLFFHNSNKRRSLYVLIAGASAMALFLIIRFSVLAHYHANGLPEISLIENALMQKGLAAESKLATTMLIMGIYMRLLFVPYPLLSDYSFRSVPYTHFSDPYVLLSIGVYILIITGWLVLFARDKKNPLAFALLFFLATMALFSNLFIMIKATAGERFLFFPSVGFCLAIALLAERLLKRAHNDIQFLKSTSLLAIMIPVCLSFSVVAMSRNADWADNLTLYKTDLEKKPDNARLNYFYGYELFSAFKQENNPTEKTRLLNEAIFYLKRSLTIYPEYGYAASDLAAAYFNAGQFDSAVTYGRVAVKYSRLDPVSRNNLSGAYLQSKRYAENVMHCKETITVLPADIFAYADIGLSYINLEQYDSAIYFLRKGIATDPAFYGCYDVMSFAFFKKNMTDSAEFYKNLAGRVRQSR